MSALVIIVEDDMNNVVERYAVNQFANAEDAQIAAIESVIEWHEDEENHDIYTVQEDIDTSINELKKYKEGLKDGEFDEHDNFTVPGFTIKSL